jgi:O-succinylbenzoic acid--CoA ligase
MLTFGNHFWSATGSAFNLGVRGDDRWLAVLPLFHVGGLAILLRSVLYGTTAIVHESFDAAHANRAIDYEGVTIVSVVANMLQRMLDERGDRPYPASLRCMLLGGGPAPEPLLRRCEAIGVPVVQTYGLTEAASQVATLAPEDALPKLGSAGKPLFGTEVRIVDTTGPCAAGAAGEIVVRGPTVSPGYLNRREESTRALRNGWLHTGDIGYLDDDGYLYVLDRRDDLIVSGGENVYPAEIEAVLQTHPAVAEAGVWGVEHARWGQVPVAAVVLRDNLATAPELLIEYCKERLAAYKVPSRIEFTNELPRNAAGKLLRSELRRRT